MWEQATGCSVKEVIAECKAATGDSVPHSFGPRRAGDAAHWFRQQARGRRNVAGRQSARRCSNDADAWRWYQTAGYSA